MSVYRGGAIGPLMALAGARTRHAGLRPGARIAIVGPPEDAATFVPALVDASAVVTVHGTFAAAAAADVELIVLATAAVPTGLATPLPPFVAVCDGCDPGTVSALVRAGALELVFRPAAPGAVLDACVHALARVTPQPLRRPAPLDLDGATGAALARTRLPVLITGETGTGKSRFARMLHDTLTPNAPFVEINAAALPGNLLVSELFGHERGAFTGAAGTKRGLVAVASRGTLFLDEIGDMAPDAQAQLLSYLDSGTYRPLGAVQTARSDARIVCATNRDLAAAVASGAFRADLYYRLASIVVPLPSLRERRETIAGLIEDLLVVSAAQADVAVPVLDAAALQAMVDCDWPGNVRQLRFVVERIVALWPGQRITRALVLELLPTTGARPGADARPAPSIGEVCSLAEMERMLVERAMAQAGGNRTRAAAMLGITPRGLYNKLRRNGKTFRSGE